jgi:hypothetical protein
MSDSLLRNLSFFVGAVLLASFVYFAFSSLDLFKDQAETREMQTFLTQLLRSLEDYQEKNESYPQSLQALSLELPCERFDLFYKVVGESYAASLSSKTSELAFSIDSTGRVYDEDVLKGKESLTYCIR